MILLFGGNLPALTSLRYATIYNILPDKPCNACTFN